VYLSLNPTTIISVSKTFNLISLDLAKDDNMNDITLKDAKFEVEIELQNHDGSDEIFMEKIKVFQCDSNSSGSDSYRIKPII